MLLAGGLLVMFIVAPLYLKSLDGPPFQMVVEPVDDHGAVQFAQVGTGRISQTFQIDSRFETRQVVVLDSAAATIPGGQIEFADITLMPGRFKIRVGQSLFDVMSGAIYVDGQYFEWRRDDSLK